ncbi:hypothetical protein [Micromonospora sp. WMMA1996]|uniref:hypothetical protein n=1 Tax=Micromonospora sp. WMMA1996 TaxID=2039878 RepID=UPI0011455259|nr:hypothetical protein [Micromonospora sp. WMMA1996]
MRYAADRSMRLLLTGPDGDVDVGSTHRTDELGRMAREAAERLYGSAGVDVSLLVDQPPWLREGMVVRSLAPADDPGETHEHPYGQVVGFLPVGGVLVWRPGTSVGVHAPEDLVPCDPDSVPPALLHEMTARTGIAAAG